MQTPEIQNIPVRTELGKEIHRSFIKPLSSTVLQSADYSRIEERIMPAPPIQVRDAAFYHTAGYNAYRLGLKALDCPYRGDAHARAWIEGYKKAKDEQAAPMPCSPANAPYRAHTIAKGPFKTPAEFAAEIRAARANRAQYSPQFIDRKRQINYRRQYNDIEKGGR